MGTHPIFESDFDCLAATTGQQRERGKGRSQRSSTGSGARGEDDDAGGVSKAEEIHPPQSKCQKKKKRRPPRRSKTRSQLPSQLQARRSPSASRATSVNNAKVMTDVAVTDVTTVVRTAVPVATTTMPTRRPMPNSIWLTTSPHLARLCATTPIIDSLGPSTKVPLVGLSWLKTKSQKIIK